MKKETYAKAEESLRTVVDGWDALGWVNASSLLVAFKGGNSPTYDGPTTVTDTIARTGEDKSGESYGLSHPLGIAFTAPANPGNTRRSLYAADSDFNYKFTGSGVFHAACHAFLQSKASEITQWFENNPESAENTFEWSNIDGDLDFNKTTDLEMWFALGHAKYTLSGLSAKVMRFNYTATDVRVSGNARDLYDFDFDGDIPGTPWVRKALFRQAGFPTCGPGGKVFFTQIQLANSLVHVEDGNPYNTQIVPE